MEQLNSMFDVWSDPQLWHAATVHFPVVLAVIGIPIVVVAAVRPGKACWRWTALGVYALLLLSALLAVNSGEGAHDRVPSTRFGDAVHAAVNDHEWWAKQVWMFAAAVIAMLGLGAFDMPRARRTLGVLAVVASLAAAGWVAATAHQGGTLVYEHGVGIANAGGTTPAIEITDAAGVEGAGGGANDPAIDPRLAHFRTNVYPVLEEVCFGCHNPKRRRGPKGGLDLTTLAAMKRGGDSGEIVLFPEHPEESKMLEAISYVDPDTAMPPDADDRLTPEQVEAIRQWIEEGAVWDGAADADGDSAG